MSEPLFIVSPVNIKGTVTHGTLNVQDTSDLKTAVSTALSGTETSGIFWQARGTVDAPTSTSSLHFNKFNIPNAATSATESATLFIEGAPTVTSSATSDSTLYAQHAFVSQKGRSLLGTSTVSGGLGVLQNVYASNVTASATVHARSAPVLIASAPQSTNALADLALLDTPDDSALQTVLSLKETRDASAYPVVGQAPSYQLLPPIALTSTAQRLQNTVLDGTYIVTASSSTESPARAFNLNLSEAWTSATNVYSSNNYVGAVSTVDVTGQTFTGEWIQIQLPQRQEISYVTIENSILSQSPRFVRVLASHDGTTWSLIGQYQTSTAANVGENYYHIHIPKFFYSARTGFFSYYRFVISQAQGSAGVQISRIGLYTPKSSLIAHYDRSQQTVKEYPPLALTSSETTLQNAPYGNGTYVATASSNLPFEDNDYDGYNAFDKSYTAPTNPDLTGWHSAENVYTNGQYTGSVTTTDDQGTVFSGEYLQLAMPKKTRIHKIGIVPRGSEYAPQIAMDQWRSPRDFVILGSNNGSTWTLITKVNNATNYQRFKISEFAFDEVSYSYYRMVVLTIGYENGYSLSTSVQIAEFLLYGTDGELLDIAKKETVKPGLLHDLIPLYSADRPEFYTPTYFAAPSYRASWDGRQRQLSDGINVFTTGSYGNAEIISGNNSLNNASNSRYTYVPNPAAANSTSIRTVSMFVYLQNNGANDQWLLSTISGSPSGINMGNGTIESPLWNGATVYINGQAGTSLNNVSVISAYNDQWIHLTLVANQGFTENLAIFSRSAASDAGLIIVGGGGLRGTMKNIDLFSTALTEEQNRRLFISQLQSGMMFQYLNRNQKFLFPGGLQQSLWNYNWYSPEYRFTSIDTNGLRGYFDFSNTSSFDGTSSTLRSLTGTTTATVAGVWSRSATGLISLNNTSATASDNTGRIVLPVINQLQTISLWYFLRSKAPDRFLMDAGTLFANTISTNIIGTEFTDATLYYNGGSAQSLTFANLEPTHDFTGATLYWHNITIVRSSGTSLAFTLFNRQSVFGTTGYDAIVGAILLYDRPLSQAENLANYTAMVRQNLVGDMTGTCTSLSTMKDMAPANFPSNYNGSTYERYSMQLQGFFKPKVSGVHTFYTQSDDGSLLYLGDSAITFNNTNDALVKNGGLHGFTEVSATQNLLAGVYYPLRVTYTEQGGGDALVVSVKPPDGPKTTDFSGYVFYGTYGSLAQTLAPEAIGTLTAINSKGILNTGTDLAVTATSLISVNAASLTSSHGATVSSWGTLGVSAQAPVFKSQNIDDPAYVRFASGSPGAEMMAPISLTVSQGFTISVLARYFAPVSGDRLLYWASPSGRNLQIQRSSTSNDAILSTSDTDTVTIPELLQKTNEFVVFTLRYRSSDQFIEVFKNGTPVLQQTWTENLSNRVYSNFYLAAFAFSNVDIAGCSVYNTWLPDAQMNAIFTQGKVEIHQRLQLPKSISMMYKTPSTQTSRRLLSRQRDPGFLVYADPASISSLHLDKISQWGTLTQTTASSQPTVYVNDPTDGETFIRFESTSPGTGTSLNIEPKVLDANFSGIVIGIRFRLRGVGASFERLFQIFSNATSAVFEMYRHEGTSGVWINFWNQTNAPASGDSLFIDNVLEQNVFMDLTIRYRASTRLLELYKNGVLIGAKTWSTAITVVSYEFGYLGREGAGTVDTNYDVSHFVLYDTYDVPLQALFKTAPDLQNALVYQNDSNQAQLIPFSRLLAPTNAWQMVTLTSTTGFCLSSVLGSGIQVASILLYDRVLTGAEHQENYKTLQAKWLQINQVPDESMPTDNLTALYDLSRTACYLGGTSNIVSLTQSPGLTYTGTVLKVYPPKDAIIAATSDYVGSYGSGRYVVTASSVISNYTAVEAFKSSNTNLCWASALNTYNGATGVYTDSVTTGSYSGEWIQIDLPRAIVLDRFEMGELNQAAWDYQNPRDFVLLGSNNGGTTWTLLYTASNVYWHSSFKFFQVSETRPFASYRIVVSRTGMYSSSHTSVSGVVDTQTLTRVTNWRLYALESDSGVTSNISSLADSAIPYNVSYSGTLRVPVSGRYETTLSSDNASVLTLAGQSFTGLSGTHAQLSVSQTSELSSTSDASVSLSVSLGAPLSFVTTSNFISLMSTSGAGISSTSDAINLFQYTLPTSVTNIYRQQRVLDSAKMVVSFEIVQRLANKAVFCVYLGSQTVPENYYDIRGGLRVLFVMSDVQSPRLLTPGIYIVDQNGIIQHSTNNTSWFTTSATRITRYIRLEWTTKADLGVYQPGLRVHVNENPVVWYHGNESIITAIQSTAGSYWGFLGQGTGAPSGSTEIAIKNLQMEYLPLPQLYIKQQSWLTPLNYYKQLSLMANSGNYTPAISQADPNVQIQLLAGWPGSLVGCHDQLRLQDAESVYISFEVNTANAAADGIQFYMGAKSPVDREYYNNWGIGVSLIVWANPGVFLTRSGMISDGLALYNQLGYSNTTSFINQGPYVDTWTTVEWIYNKSIIGTHEIKINGTTVITYNDPNLYRWLETQSGSFYGIAARTGGATMEAWIRRVNVRYTRPGIVDASSMSNTGTLTTPISAQRVDGALRVYNKDTKTTSSPQSVRYIRIQRRDQAATAVGVQSIEVYNASGNLVTPVKTVATSSYVEVDLAQNTSISRIVVIATNPNTSLVGTAVLGYNDTNQLLIVHDITTATNTHDISAVTSDNTNCLVLPRGRTKASVCMWVYFESNPSVILLDSVNAVVRNSAANVYVNGSLQTNVSLQKYTWYFLGFTGSQDPIMTLFANASSRRGQDTKCPFIATYDRALSNTEIANIYQATKRRYFVETPSDIKLVRENLMGYFDFSNTLCALSATNAQSLAFAYTDQGSMLPLLTTTAPGCANSTSGWTASFGSRLLSTLPVSTNKTYRLILSAKTSGTNTLAIEDAVSGSLYGTLTPTTSFIGTSAVTFTASSGQVRLRVTGTAGSLALQTAQLARLSNRDMLSTMSASALAPGGVLALTNGSLTFSKIQGLRTLSIFYRASNLGSLAVSGTNSITKTTASGAFLNALVLKNGGSPFILSNDIKDETDTWQNATIILNHSIDSLSLLNGSTAAIGPVLMYDRVLSNDEIAQNVSTYQNYAFLSQTSDGSATSGSLLSTGQAAVSTFFVHALTSSSPTILASFIQQLTTTDSTTITAQTGGQLLVTGTTSTPRIQGTSGRMLMTTMVSLHSSTGTIESWMQTGGATIAGTLSALSGGIASNTMMIASAVLQPTLDQYILDGPSGQTTRIGNTLDITVPNQTEMTNQVITRPRVTLLAQSGDGLSLDRQGSSAFTMASDKRDLILGPSFLLRTDGHLSTPSRALLAGISLNSTGTSTSQVRGNYTTLFENASKQAQGLLSFNTSSNTLNLLNSSGPLRLAQSGGVIVPSLNKDDLLMTASTFVASQQAVLLSVGTITPLTLRTDGSVLTLSDVILQNHRVQATAECVSPTSGGACTVYGGMGVAKSVRTGSTVFAEGKQIDASPGSLAETSFTFLNNQTNQPVSGFLLSPSTVRSIVAYVTVTVTLSGSVLTAMYTLRAIRRTSDYVLTQNVFGDPGVNVAFDITSLGQLLYTSPNYAGFSSGVMKFIVQTTTV